MKSLLLVLTASVCLQAAAQVQPPDAWEQNRRLGRGVNIIGYDPIWHSPAQARFQEKHFRLLQEAGFQSVRINLHAFRVRYTGHAARTAEAAGWSWACWQFDSDFILWDMKRDAWVEPILHALIPTKP